MNHTIRVSVCGLAVLVVAVGCKSKAKGSADAVAASPVVTLERGPCYGRCPEYQVKLFEDGTVVFEGRRNVSAMGTVRGTASADALRKLLNEVQQGAFSSVDTLFVDGNPSCGQYRTDAPISVLAAKVGNQMKTVRHDPGCTNAPRFLTTLEAQVDSVAGTRAWIFGSGGANK